MKEKTVFKPLTDVKERAVLVGVILKDQPVEQEMEYLDELAFLAETAGAQTLKSFTQKLDHTEPRTFVGSGKLAEINEYIKANEINLAVFDDELSPSQQRNIEKILQIKVLDRTQLILDIFARRARTAQAQVQVELAQYQYLMPRLTRIGHTSRNSREESATVVLVKKKLKQTGVLFATD